MKTTRSALSASLQLSIRSFPAKPCFRTFTLALLPALAAAVLAQSPPTLFFDISGSASLAGSAGQSYRVSPGGTFSTNAPSYAYSGRAEDGGASSSTSASAETSAYATFGLLRASVAAGAGTGGEWLGPNAGAGGNTRIAFNDKISVFSPSRAGQSGTVVGRVRVNGLMSASTAGWTSRASAGAQVGVGAVSYSRNVYSDSGVPSESGDLPLVIEYSVNLIFSPTVGGQTFWQPISVGLYVSASASALNFFNSARSAQGASGFFSVVWDGIVEVRDSQGLPVNDWTVQSASGFDYGRSYEAGIPRLTIVPAGPGAVTVSWSPNAPGFVLQETLSPSAGGWTNSPSGGTNPVTVPATFPARFYRLARP